MQEKFHCGPGPVIQILKWLRFKPKLMACYSIFCHIFSPLTNLFQHS